ncbi:MAG: hypothetical protein QOF89_5853 [Acidobacteriota bacterium]|jgi:predicted dithiol-disulfide oxidoreductase (DUF899 family)|nr:hypothetical protein [Acidobacteriota bacterium]
MASSQEGVRFPNETPEYRSSRDQLLQAEVELRRKLEDVAALRQTLPLGGQVKEDYVSRREAAIWTTSRRKAGSTFGAVQPGKDSLILYSYMFGPAMRQPCTSCTSILDGLNGTAPHVMQRVNFAVVAKSPIERIRGVARERGWRNHHLLSSEHNSYNTDYHGEDPAGNQLPALNVFVRRPDGIYHSYNTELLYAPSEPGQDGRHVDLIWPLWNLFDYTPEGRGSGWYPKLGYGAAE